MPYANNIITAPVGKYDVERAIGVASTDVGELCQHVNVNRWAKWKPIKCPTVELLTSAKMTVLTAYRYGIIRHGAGVVPLFDPSTHELNHDVWDYDKPTGGATAPYRLADFGCWDTHANPGYYHLAPCPVKMVFPEPAEINVPNFTSGNKIGFVFTFENGIIGWRTDGTCLTIQDIFANDRNYWLTLGLYRNVGGVQKQYYISSDMTLAQMSAENPVAVVLLDIDDFKSKIGYSYLADGQEWTAIMFLTVSRQVDGSGGGVTNLSGNIVMLEYEQNADRKTMKIVKDSWAQGFGTISLTTFLTQDGTNQYRIYKSGGQGLSLYINRDDPSRAMTLSVSYRLICVGGVVGSHGSEVQFTEGDTISIPAGQQTATFQVPYFTGYNFIFDANASIKRAIINVILTYGNNSGSISIGTDTDCAGGSSTYETVNAATY